MAQINPKVGNIYIGDQVAFQMDARLNFGTVMGFGYTTVNGKLEPFLKIAEMPQLKVLSRTVERVTNQRTGRSLI